MLVHVEIMNETNELLNELTVLKQCKDLFLLLGGKHFNSGNFRLVREKWEI